MHGPMIEAIGIGKSFGQVTALSSVDISVHAGTVHGLLGHNGAGKTTLINILCTVLPPNRGTARIAGFDVVGQSHEVRSRIGLTGQYAAVDENLSGTDNLILIARLLGASRRQARARAHELLEIFDLTKAAHRPSRTYSGGMRRRLDLATSLVGRPDVVFLDEPTTGLDPNSRLALWEVVEGIVREGAAVLLTTQYLDEADRLAEAITVLADGSVVASGTSAQLKSQVGSRAVHIVPAAPADSYAIMLALGQAGLTPHQDEVTGSISTPAETSADLATVVRALDQGRLDVTEFSLTEPTLDDVYLALTKRPTVLAN